MKENINCLNSANKPPPLRTHRYSNNDQTQTLAENSGRSTTTLASTASTVVPGSKTKFTGFSEAATAQGGTVFYGQGSTDATSGIFVSSSSGKVQTVTTLGSYSALNYPVNMI